MINLNALAQKSKYVIKDDWSFGVSTGIDYSYRFLKPFKDYPKTNIYKVRQEREIPRFQYNIGFNALYKTASIWSFESGFQFSNLGFKTHSIPYDILPAVIYYKYRFVNIPLGVNVTTEGDKFKFTGSIYITPSINFQASRKVKYLKPHADESGYFNKFKMNDFNLFLGAAAGAIYTISDRVYIRIQSEFKSDLFSRHVYGYAGSPEHTYLWSLGLNFGCFYNI